MRAPVGHARDAVAAHLAVGLDHGAPERGGDQRVEAALAEVQDVALLDFAADRHAAPAEDAAVGVVGDEGRVLAGLVAARLGPLEAIGEHLVVDAVALQVALAVGLAGALQAQVGAAHRLVLGEAELDLLEVGLAVLGPELGHARRRAHFGDAGVDVDEHRRHLGHTTHARLEVGFGLQSLDEGRAAQVVQLLRDRLHVVAAQEGVHAPGRLLALGDGLDGRLRAEHGVAAGEDLGVGGLQRPVVDGERAPARVGKALRLAGAVELGELADGADHLIALDDELRTLLGNGPAAAGRVGLAELHTDHLDAADLAGIVGEHRDGGHLEHETHALFLGLVDLGVVGGHLGARAAVEAGDLFGAEPDGGAAGVHGGEAAADDRDLAPHVDLAVALEIAEEIDRRDDPGSVLAGAAHGVGAEGAQSEEDGVVLGAQVVERKSTPRRTPVRSSTPMRQRMLSSSSMMSRGRR